ncbi:FAD-binding oxidoreductase [Roseinatronobacter alkalisoli]|uniref:D-lactate dehydrogenase (cytochrome) n=1 Tax=Roseinatronobacter alkalisoli TaxID=3028235 RepID=A0ABT5T7S0_9RHOB|nr:FAD-linked oxidase C-terminal domain-containing protein [Roseinatronobacter sp. HJB301]MDD7971168.1 FAD-linked oxidase C-terminal domain-containing protein [Roseinatronobacter sp. HJB301]
MTSPMQPAFDALHALLGDRFTTGTSDRALHGQSESHFPDMPPDGVAYPETTAEVAGIVSICTAHGLPVIGWGAGTSLEGHALAPHGGITVDFSRMNRVLHVSAEDMLVVVQPGVTREQLNEELRATGLFFPVDPGANATLGGMASTRASGTTAVRYGTMRGNVLALEVVLADGRTLRTGTRAPKSSTGYDLTALFVGAEGTLGLITELTLRLQGQPEAVSAAVCAFDDMEAATQTVILTIQSGIPMARIEFIDATFVRVFNAQNGTDMPEKPHLMVEFHGTTQSTREQAESFGEIVTDMGGSAFQWAERQEDRNRLWKMRHNAYYAARAQWPDVHAMTTDVCVPISKLAQAVTETASDIAQSGLPGPILGHVGDGNFHVLLLPDRDDPAQIAKANALAHRMAERALRLGGTVSGEHGIGMGKLKYMDAEHGAGWDVMTTLKTALDPQGIMNPGKLLRQT